MYFLHQLWEESVCKSLHVHKHHADMLANTKYKGVGMAALHNGHVRPFKVGLSAIAVFSLLSSPTSLVSSRLYYHQCLLLTLSVAMSCCTLSGHWVCHCAVCLSTFKAITHQQLGTNIIQAFEVKRILELDQVLISTPAFPIELRKGFNWMWAVKKPKLFFRLDRACKSVLFLCLSFPLSPSSLFLHAYPVPD